MARVLTYRRIFTMGIEVFDDICPFTQSHADEIGTVLENDGIPLELAKKLCKKWNKMNSNYHYSIPL